MGPNGEPVHVTGTLDYVFYDWRTERHRILDYKLTPGGQPTNDLFQVCVYALMHHAQHGTAPDVGVTGVCDPPEELCVNLSYPTIDISAYSSYYFS